MSDKPLFQNTDAQEAAYDPEGNNEDDTRARVDADVDDSVIIPAGAAGMSGSLSGGVSSVAGTPVGPAVGAAALEEESEDTDSRRER